MRACPKGNNTKERAANTVEAKSHSGSTGVARHGGTSVPSGSWYRAIRRGTRPAASTFSPLSASHVASYDFGGVAMRNGTTRILTVAGLTLATLGVARPSSAQCGGAIAIMSRDVSLAPGNPFQAERTTTHTPPRDPRLPTIMLMNPEIVARDSQGRVRFDRPLGEVHVQTGPDAGADVRVHVIEICDPVQGEITQLDNANRSATIRHLVSLSAPPSSATSPVFCQVPANPKDPSNPAIEDLGHRSIEGFDAQGWRITTLVQMPNTSPPAKLQRIRELWCSEELGAVLLESASGSLDGPKQEAALTKIERIEPDPKLFEIPSDYTVSDAIQQPRLGGSGIAQPIQPPLVSH
jgi:hypothetical protein